MEDYRILFVCLGNICRSPLAHAVMLGLVEERGLSDLVKVDSCGTGSWHIGERAHRGSLEVARRNGVDLDFHRARQFCREDWSRFRLIVAMDRENLETLERLRGSSKSEVILLRQHDPKNGSRAAEAMLDLPDPYYTGKFDEVYSIVKRCCSNLLDRIEAELK